MSGAKLKCISMIDCCSPSESAVDVIVFPSRNFIPVDLLAHIIVMCFIYLKQARGHRKSWKCFHLWLILCVSWHFIIIRNLGGKKSLFQVIYTITLPAARIMMR